ncbi:MAG: hypothetical protein RL220_1189 [Bacteroidota bacterium]
MRKSLLLFVALTTACSVFAQSFSDDFESYSAGDMLGEMSDVWTTWSGNDGGSDDSPVSSANAHSGSNSVYFSSTSSSGGPQDCVLPFGGELSTGQFNLEMWMYVNPSTGGYFNFQQEDAIGVTWAMDCYLTNTALIQFTSGGSLQLETAYPFGEWFKLRMEMNLSTNSWTILINDEDRGSFANGATQIASMDIYPLQGNQFYVDDVAYDYTPYELPALNGAVTSITGMTTGLAGQQVAPTVVVRNLGTTAINSFDIAVEYNGNSYSQQVTGLNLASLGFYEVSFTDEFTLVAGMNDAIATISNVNGQLTDGDGSDDEKILVIDPVVPAAGKIVVAEEGTGTWCPWCVRGHVFMELLSERYDGYFAGIAVHNADPMTVYAYDQAMAGLISGYPSGVVDRGPEYDPSQFEIPFLERIQIAPAAFIENGAEYDSGTGLLNVSLSTTFQAAVSGNYKIALVLTEDGVTGTGSDWAQQNAYAGGGNGEMGGYEDLPSPVPASQMVYDHVARLIIPSFGGMPNAFEASVDAGDEFVHNFTMMIPADWDASGIHIIGMVIAPDGTIENASYTTIEEAVANGFVDGEEVVGVTQVDAPDATVQVYPNPASDICQLLLQLDSPQEVVVEILASDGRLVVSRDYGQLAGSQVFPINVEGFESGMYMIRVMTGKTWQTQTFIKE